jgi:hypothetical protein
MIDLAANRRHEWAAINVGARRILHGNGTITRNRSAIYGARRSRTGRSDKIPH